MGMLVLQRAHTRGGGEVRVERKVVLQLQAAGPPCLLHHLPPGAF